MSERITEAMPVDLLRDARGIFGIGVTESHDLEALAWSCGVDAEKTYIPSPRPIILWPDYLERAKRPHGCGYAALQKIIGGFRRGPFKRPAEKRLRQFIHHEALRRAGLPWPPPDHHEQWWSNDKARQVQNRRTYHGLRLLSLCIINRLIDHDVG